MSRRVVVIGAGQAGASLAMKLRSLGHAGEITLIGAEKEAPYQRPPLSKAYLLGQLDAGRLELKPPAAYRGERITLLTGEPVEAIDRASRSVVTAKRRVPYDVVALTTGAKVREWPAEKGGALENVHTLRSRADADRLAARLVEGRRLLVVGGGYIGLEIAAAGRRKGMDVTVVELAPRILTRVASAATADAIRALHEANHVHIREGTGVERLIGADGRVVAAELDNGERIACDVAVIGIGIDPDVRLARQAGLRIENGIAVDGQGRTSDPAIFAAGDCASFPFRGSRVRLESVQNAIDQAEHVAEVIHGTTRNYEPVPWFWSDQFSARLQIAGLSSGHDRIVTRPGTRPGGRSVWYFKGDRLLAVDAVSDPTAYMQGKRWLELGVSPDPARIGDGGAELKTLA